MSFNPDCVYFYSSDGFALISVNKRSPDLKYIIKNLVHRRFLDGDFPHLRSLLVNADTVSPFDFMLVVSVAVYFGYEL